MPFARDAYVPGVDRGFSYDYLGTLFTWRRSTTSGNLIGQILGYRNGSFVSSTDMTVYMEQSAPHRCQHPAQSLQLLPILPDSVYGHLQRRRFRQSRHCSAGISIDCVCGESIGLYGNFITAVAASTPLTPSQLPYSMNDSGYENNTILDNMIWAIPYGEDTNLQAGLEEAIFC